VERLQVFPVVLGQCRAQRREIDLVDVEVAHAVGLLLQPAKVLLGPGDHVRWQHLLVDLPECRAGAPDRDTEVVQVLGVNGGGSPRLVALHGVEQCQVDAPRRLQRGHVRVEPQSELGAVVPGHRADGPHALLVQGLLGDRGRQSPFDQRAGAGKRPEVAAQRYDGQLGTERCLATALRTACPQVIDRQSQDDLALGIMYGERRAS
jgi:hypothetical protein